MSLITVVRATEEFKKRGLKVGQFFAKHKKLEEQAFFLKSNVARVALGTPGRIQKLIEEGSLKVEGIKYLVVDMSRDTKTFTIMDIRTTREDFFNLYNAHFKERVKTEKTHIVYF
jgi:protein CMS1